MLYNNSNADTCTSYLSFYNFVFFFGVTYIKFNFLINLHIDEFVIDHRECDKHMARV